MEDVIREGSLRLLATEGSCDVIISCSEYKLMAHKIILSIASPVLQDLLRDQCVSQPTVLIFPEVPATIMSLILDYIYTGHVTLLLTQIHDFLAVSELLKIKVEDDCYKVLMSAVARSKTEKKDSSLVKLQKHLVPDLIPISRARHKRIRASFNKVIPSPWTPRDKEVLVDPRSDYRQSGNDSNNNVESSILLAGFQDSRYVKKHVPVAASTFTSSECGVIEEQSTSSSALLKEEEPAREGREEREGQQQQQQTADSGLREKDEKKDKPFKCNDCGKQFSQLRNFKYHRSVHDGTKEFSTRCPECGKVFNDKGYLSSHMKIHRDRKEYACQHCPKRFNQRVAYNMHLRIHTGVKPHECTDCGKSFSRKMLLKQHQRVHTGERPYTCTECGKSFADRSNMSLHARLHTGVKPYSCTLCPKSFTKKHHLKTHMNFHTGLKPYKCEKCGLAFSQSSNMRTHYKKCILKNNESNS